MIHIIETNRLRLQRFTLDILDACLHATRLEAERLAGVSIPDVWMNEVDYIERKRTQLTNDPTYAAWCTRMVVLKATNQMIGHIAFHTPPGPPGLGAIAPGGVELGYSIYGPHRRQGYAKEAAIGMMRWASTENGIQSFVVSVSPDNAASQALAKSLGFVKVGEQMDEVDGLEEVFVLQGPALARTLSA